LTGGIFLDARFSEPWCIVGKVAPEACAPFMPRPNLVMCFHYIVEGRCLIRIEGQETCEVAEGEALLIPRNDPHLIGSDLSAPVVPANEIMQAPRNIGLSRIEHGGGGKVCAMVCGFLGGDDYLATLINALPSMIKLRTRETPGGDWISQSFSFAARELANGDPGAASIISRMSELLFVEAIRRHLTSMPDEQTGLLAGLRDPVIGKALALMHSQVGKAWTAEELADEVGMSRSAFADRFVSVIGDPPMRYLTGWRMQVAMQKLKDGHHGIARIAFETGYESEAAFARAFKREIGVPPATWRRKQQSGEPSVPN
jgi:AraC-like DNA-binding protein